MKKYTYVAIVLIAVFAGLYCSCQCNNPTTEEPETEPTPSQPANPQDGAHTPSAGHGPGKQRGITNCGDTCYMNASLQVVFSLYKDLIEAKRGTDKDLAKSLIKLFDMVNDPALETPVEYSIPDAFHTAMKKSEAGGGLGYSSPTKQQEDASEFLTLILEWLSVPNIKAYKTSINVDSGAKRNAEEKQSVKVEVKLKDGIASMQEAIDMYFQEEIMEGENAVDWYGEKKKTICKTQLKELDKIYNNTLIISLGRFRNDLTKNGTAVNSLMEIEIKKDYTVDLATDKTYLLVGFIYHSGSTPHSGHYIAYIKEDTKWICYNDSSVSEVSDAEAEAAAQEAYVFFYQPK